MAKNPVITYQTKHILTRYRLARQFVEEKDIRVNYCLNDENIVDIFTRALPADHQRKLTTKLGLLESMDDCVGVDEMRRSNE